MQKDYQNWTPVKADINNKGLRPAGYKVREIWIANIGENIGHEEDGKGDRFARPVRIVSAFSTTCFVLPLSTTDKRGRYYYEFDGHTGKQSIALLSQPRTIDSARLRRRIGYISKMDFDDLKDLLRGVLDL